MATIAADPVRYDPSLEQLEDDEAETGRALDEQFRIIQQTTAKDYGHGVRAVHAKSHGLLEAELEIVDGLPPLLAQGLFAQGGRYRAVMRFSTNPGDILDDSISVPRGLAIKVAGVDGDRLPGSEGDATQDFILVNGPAFTAPKGKQFLANLKLLAKTTDRAEGAKKLLSAVLRGTEEALETLGFESAKLKNMGGAPQVHPLGETYYSQVPFLYGANIVKFAVAPVSDNLLALTGDRIDASGRPTALREEIAAVIGAGPAEWELRVQFCTDPERMPIEDATVEWDEAESPFVTVARLRAEAQPGWTAARAAVVDDALAFSVWHGLAAHRPLGAINRLRRIAYDKSAAFRGQVNGCPIHEPATIEPLPR